MKKPFETTIDFIEKEFKVHSCMHHYNRRIVDYFKVSDHHNNPYCIELKMRRPDYTRHCLNFDGETTLEYLRNSGGNYCWKLCPCGLLEVVFAVYVGGRFGGSLTLGPFDPGKGPLPKPLFSVGVRKKFEYLEEVRHKLPPVPAGERRELLCALGQLIVIQFGKEQESRRQLMSKDERVAMIIANSYRSPLNLAQVAKLVELSPARVSQLMREHYGTTFNKMLMDYRIEKAKALLLNSRSSISHVAKFTGFTDPAYFHRVFKKHTGKSPSEFRNQKN